LKISREDINAINKIGFVISVLVQGNSSLLWGTHCRLGIFFSFSIMSCIYQQNFDSCFFGSTWAPTFYIFFASALPVIVFGQQLHRDTGKTISFYQHSNIWANSYCHLVDTKSWLMFLLVSFHMVFFDRWNYGHSGNNGIYCYLWNYPLNIWWPTFVDFRSCWTHCHNVHLLVQYLPKNPWTG